jgi:hypothetical protein
MRDVNAIGCQALLGFRIFPAQFRRSECARGTAKDIRAVTAAPRETGFPLVLYIERQRCVNHHEAPIANPAMTSVTPVCTLADLTDR